MKHLLCLTFIVTFCSNTFAFDWNKCKRYLNKDNSMTGGAGFSSTTSFFSSIGECSMLGQAEHDKKVYLAHNFYKMREDFSKGGGEYAQSFAKMHGCSRKAQSLYPEIMKRNFHELIQARYGEISQETYEYIESFFYGNHVLKRNCIVSET